MRPEDRIPLIFNFLLQAIKPKALFVHGDTAAAYIRSHYQTATRENHSVVSFPHGDCPVIFAPHLAARNGLVTNEKVAEWGKLLKNALIN